MTAAQPTPLRRGPFGIAAAGAILSIQSDLSDRAVPPVLVGAVSLLVLAIVLAIRPGQKMKP